MRWLQVEASHRLRNTRFNAVLQLQMVLKLQHLVGGEAHSPRQKTQKKLNNDRKAG
jgi:hypothetical protein